jgi:hypothetical protein
MLLVGKQFPMCLCQRVAEEKQSILPLETIVFELKKKSELEVCPFVPEDRPGAFRSF